MLHCVLHILEVMALHYPCPSTPIPCVCFCVNAQCNYFYRLNDFPSGSVDPGSKNGRMFAKALVTLGIADSIQSAEELMGRKGTSTRAGRLLNKFVSAATLASSRWVLLCSTCCT